MGTKIGIIAEGPIDHALLPPLLSRIAHDKANFRWPLDVSDMAEPFPMRKRGHGGVLETVRKLVRALDNGPYDHDCFVIVLDRKTAAVQTRIRRLISGRPRFVLGTAIEEIEAWWLGDRTNTFAWTALDPQQLPSDCTYGSRSYSAEKDTRPKRTLDSLTRLSDQFDRFYGNGNLDMAHEFAEEYWRRCARLAEISSQCPRGFRPFQKSMINAFRRAKAASRRLF